MTGGLDYFDYQRRVAQDVLLPWLAERMTLRDACVADFGCHAGGMLEGLRTSEVAGLVGYELNESIVRESPLRVDERVRVEIADLTKLNMDGRFDLVLLHDVLEHVIEPGSVLSAARRALVPGGRLFVSFPPYWSAFGGHQHLAAGYARAVPYVHYLPSRWFYRLARPADNEYMSSADSLDDLVSVRCTRLSLRSAERAFSEAGFTVAARELFLLRPEYTVRYGVKTVRAGVVGTVPGVRELLVNGAFYLLATEPAPAPAVA